MLPSQEAVDPISTKLIRLVRRVLSIVLAAILASCVSFGANADCTCSF